VIETHPISVTTDAGIHLVGEVRGPAEAPLVMLLHGGGQTRHAWSSAAKALVAAGFSVGTYDARGHGDSDWAADKDYSMLAHARDLVAVLRAIGRPAALVGASMGGISSLIASFDAPDLVRALVLVDIVPRYAPEGVARVRAFMQGHPDGFATIEEAAAAVQAYNPNRAPSRSPSGLMRSLREGNDGRLRWHWDPAVVGDAPDATLSDLLSARLAALPASLPLMLISGAQSDVVDADAIAGFRAQAPQAEIVSVSQAGHMVAGDRNDDFAEAIIGFLQRVG
jgi:pimeloyl-ACP methyl ester carboxylesterase